MGWYDRKVRRVRDLSCGDTRIFLELEGACHVKQPSGEIRGGVNSEATGITENSVLLLDAEIANVTSPSALLGQEQPRLEQNVRFRFRTNDAEIVSSPAASSRQMAQLCSTLDEASNASMAQCHRGLEMTNANLCFGPDPLQNTCTGPSQTRHGKRLRKAVRQP